MTCLGCGKDIETGEKTVEERPFTGGVWHFKTECIESLMGSAARAENEAFRGRLHAMRARLGR